MSGNDGYTDAMRKLPSLMAILILLGLVPIAVWGWLISELVDANQYAAAGGRKGGQAVLDTLIVVIAFTPVAIGGVMMATGGALLRRKPRGSRIVSTIGIGIVLVAILLALVIFIQLGFYFAQTKIWYLAGAVAAYLAVHIGLIVWLWNSRPAAADTRSEGARAVT